MKQKGIIRTAVQSDSSAIDDFLHQRTIIHRHLDWRQPTEWIGKSPFLLYLSPEKSIKAILNCAPEPQDIYWIRLFAFKNKKQRATFWNILFNKALRLISNQSTNPTIATLAYQEWMISLLNIGGWAEQQRVMQFTWDNTKKGELFDLLNSSPAIRHMTHADLIKIASIDGICFEPLWQQSQEAIEHAYSQSAYATVFEKNQIICGFQISTMENEKAHLARLAVLPDYQKQRIGEQLVIDMLKYFDNLGSQNISVNTQKENYNSIGLYNKLHFKKTTDSFPIYFYIE